MIHFPDESFRELECVSCLALATCITILKIWSWSSYFIQVTSRLSVSEPFPKQQLLTYSNWNLFPPPGLLMSLVSFSPTYLFCNADHCSLQKFPTIIYTEATLPFLLNLSTHPKLWNFSGILSSLSSQTGIYGSHFLLLIFISLNSITVTNSLYFETHASFGKTTAFQTIRFISLSVCFSSHFSRWTWLSRCQNVFVLDLIGAKVDGGGGDNWSFKTCKAPLKSSPPTN